MSWKHRKYNQRFIGDSLCFASNFKVSNHFKSPRNINADVQHIMSDSKWNQMRFVNYPFSHFLDLFRKKVHLSELVTPILDNGMAK